MGVASGSNYDHEEMETQQGIRSKYQHLPRPTGPGLAGFTPPAEISPSSRLANGQTRPSRNTCSGGSAGPRPTPCGPPAEIDGEGRRSNRVQRLRIDPLKIPKNCPDRAPIDADDLAEALIVTHDARETFPALRYRGGRPHVQARTVTYTRPFHRGGHSLPSSEQEGGGGGGNEWARRDTVLPARAPGSADRAGEQSEAFVGELASERQSDYSRRTPEQ